MSRWFRFYTEALDDPKVQTLPGDLFKVWVNLLCIASKHGGQLPVIYQLTYLLRRRSDRVERDLSDLVKRGLLDLVDDHLEPHKWSERQYKSDTSAPRTRQWRDRHRDVTRDDSETAPDNRVQNTDKTLVQIGDLNGPEKPAPKKRTSEPDPLFLEFYSAYPRRQSKQDAIRAYAQVRKGDVSHETIMRGLEMAKRADSRFRELRFTPLPASWLRAGGFEDEPAAQPKQSDADLMRLMLT